MDFLGPVVIWDWQWLGYEFLSQFSEKLWSDLVVIAPAPATLKLALR